MNCATLETECDHVAAKLKIVAQRREREGIVVHAYSMWHEISKLAESSRSIGQKNFIASMALAESKYGIGNVPTDKTAACAVSKTLLAFDGTRVDNDHGADQSDAEEEGVIDWATKQRAQALRAQMLVEADGEAATTVVPPKKRARFSSTRPLTPSKLSNALFNSSV